MRLLVAFLCSHLFMVFLYMDIFIALFFFLSAFNQDLGANIVPANMKACVGMIVSNPWILANHASLKRPTNFLDCCQLLQTVAPWTDASTRHYGCAEWSRLSCTTTVAEKLIFCVSMQQVSFDKWDTNLQIWLILLMSWPLSFCST